MATISAMATEELRRVDKMAARVQGSNTDPYTKAHLADVRTRIRKALDARYVIPQ